MGLRDTGPYEAFLEELYLEKKKKLEELLKDPRALTKRRKEVERLRKDLVTLEEEAKNFRRKVVEHRPHDF